LSSMSGDITHCGAGGVRAEDIVRTCLAT
jgi:hypothetical protein